MTRANPGHRRPWRNLVLAIVIVIVALLGLALWSEWEDARRLPPAEMEGVEEGFDGPL